MVDLVLSALQNNVHRAVASAVLLCAVPCGWHAAASYSAWSFPVCRIVCGC
jgi:hypothetical protein